MINISASERNRHEYYMRMALSLARRGIGRVSPNPRVGCVIVDYASPDGHVVSRGYHKQYGGPHAEAAALADAGRSVCGCTAYVTLEPCCHTGHTPPCCDALIKAGITRVVAGMADPDPRVSGGGVRALESSGAEVICGVLEDECRRINRGFIKRVNDGRPWVTIKSALSTDGRVALPNGESQWITGVAARRKAHMLRAENDVVMVGIGTVLKDDPKLNVRDTDGKSPMKAIVDRDLASPDGAAALMDGERLIFTGRPARQKRAAQLRNAGIKIVELETGEDGHISPSAILNELGAMGMNYLMIEGGAGLVGSFLKSGNVDELSLFIAPKLMGRGMTMTSGLSFSLMDEVVEIKDLDIRRVGEDVWLRGTPSCSRAL
ncbi:MAG: bifunctional diaminohydroxyphosphoribosylaminopyrimidine deaminase/5-amino-6-(5-phosphoribosylamino)uracil reductase RibD [Synergistaceae bacterium]|nr:bifunctional diaminohydroxyphosphoribosylaminopyrimidine deaminase/5-amino-6-(5-phosphoribosylamino)uracil reductase RibD [Synergistaceae bacterium]